MQKGSHDLTSNPGDVVSAGTRPRVCSCILAAWPTHLFSSFRAGDLRLGDLVREKLLEGFVNLLWRSRFDDLSLWQPMAQQLLEAARPRQADVVGQPFRLLA